MHIYIYTYRALMVLCLLVVFEHVTRYGLLVYLCMLLIQLSPLWSKTLESLEQCRKVEGDAGCSRKVTENKPC